MFRCCMFSKIQNGRPKIAIEMTKDTLKKMNDIMNKRA